MQNKTQTIEPHTESFEKIHNLIKTDSISLLRNYLTPLQIFCLKILILQQIPLQTGYFYNRSIEYLYIVAGFSDNEDGYKQIMTTAEWLPNYENALTYRNSFTKEEKHRTVQIIKDKLSAKIKAGMMLDSQEFILFMHKALKGANIIVPSFDRIKHCLEELELFRFIMKRNIVGEKGGFMWALHPDFLVIGGNKFKDIVHLRRVVTL